MAKYIAPHGRICSTQSQISRAIDELDLTVFGTNRTVDVPDTARQHIETAKTHIAAGLLEFNKAALLLIEADAAGLSEKKED